MEGEEAKPGLSSQDEDSGLSMVDVLEEEKQLEDDANAVLGGSDANNCTYDMGYVARQALYACSTCSKQDGAPAGLCLACSYDCHEGHTLYELYTKRNFKCDCGNSKLPDTKCKLRPNKASTNEENEYNQNFRGVYCTCGKPYPDPEDEVEDEMIQCICCEDWFHGRHLGTKVPKDFDEMTCNKCMTKHSFLWAYAVTGTEMKLRSSENTDPVNVSKCDDKDNESAATSKEPEPLKQDTKEDTIGVERSEEKSEENPPKPSSGTDIDKAEASGDLKPDGDGCYLEELQKRKVEKTEGAVFWSDGWRKKLCTCVKCMVMYEEQNVAYLLDEGDTVQSYEDKGKSSSTSSQYDKGMHALSEMDRMQQVEVLTEYNDLKTELKDYLQKFADNKKMVREEDIKEFFTQMQARKRQRPNPGGAMQYFCK